MADKSLQPWKTLDSQEVFSAPPWIKVHRQRVELPEGKIVSDYHKIDLPDFAMIYAEVPDGRVLVEKQYKHGLGQVSLVLPAGITKYGEDPLAAAKRELMEETGYHSNEWTSLGSFAMHGSYGCCQAHIFKAVGAFQTTDPDSGDLEEMDIVLMTKEELISALGNGEIGLLGTAAVVALATNPLFNPY